VTLRDQAGARRAQLRAQYPNLCPPPLPAIIPKTDPSSIVIGGDIRQKPVSLPFLTRNGHVFMTGTTGSGKSRDLLFIGSQIAAKEAFISIEPHGANSDALIRRLAHSEKTVHVIDFGSSHCIPFNPLWCPPGSDPSAIAGCARDAISVTRNDEPQYSKPTTERVFDTIFYTAAELNLTFLELPMLLDIHDEHGLRSYAIQHVSHPDVRKDLQRLQELAVGRKREFDQEIIGPLNRLARLIRPRALRNILGQSKNTLDIGAVMDRGEIIIAKLAASPLVYESDADLLGRLLLRSIIFHAARRKNTRPCTVMIDEASRYFSGDVTTLLTEVRKFGVSMILALQYLEQARQHDENMLAAFLNCCNVQIAFRAGDAEESERRAYSMVPLDLETEVKATIKPSVVGYRIIKLKNESQGTQQSITDSASHTDGESEGVSETEARMLAVTEGTSHGTADTRSSSKMHSVSDAATDLTSSSMMTASSHGSIDVNGSSTGEVLWTNAGILGPTENVSSRSSRGTSENQGLTSGNSSGQSSGKAHGRSRGTSHGGADTVGSITTYSTMKAETEAESFAISKSFAKTRSMTTGQANTSGTSQSAGTSEALEPILEWLPSAVHSKDNMLYMAGKLLRSLPTGTAFVSFVGPNGPYATVFKVPKVFMHALPPKRFTPLLNDIFSRDPIALPVEQAVQNISDRERRIIERCKPRTKKIADERDQSNKKGTWGRG
jgi:hypothetical protein